MRFSCTKIKKFARQLRESSSSGEKASVMQILNMMILGIRYGFSPLEYYIYGFDKQLITRKEKLSYISNEKIIRKFRPTLNNKKWIPILQNKLFFFLYYSQFNFPVVQVYGFYFPGRGFFFNGYPLKDENDCARWLNKSKVKSLVIKPVGSLGGKGIMVFDEIVSSEIMRCNDGKNYSLKEVFSFMNNDIGTRQRKEDSYRGYIIEGKIVQDSSMNILAGKSLNTIRVSTLTSDNNDILVDFGMLRVGKKGSLTDNLHQGGYVVNINVTDGSIDERTFGYKGKEGPWIEEKEEKVKELFPDGKVPFWNDVVLLAKRASSVSPELRTVGWDIAISKNGPILMEGNDNWDMVIAQVLDGGYLTDDRREILSKYGLEFAR